jgi:hypothetical protein
MTAATHALESYDIQPASKALTDRTCEIAFDRNIRRRFDMMYRG